ncbi:MAG: hypothetical protein ABH869_02065 [Candidatus Omnitrophota bacterium]
MPNKRISSLIGNDKKKRNKDREKITGIEISSKTVKKVFNPNIIRRIAKESKFIQRARKFDAYDFFYH